MTDSEMGRDHLEDATLLRLLDEEGEARSASETQVGSASAESLHLRSCAECGARSEALARRSGALSMALQAADREVPTPNWDADFLARIGVSPRARSREEHTRDLRARSWVNSTALRWAAVIAVLLAVGSVAPVRAWIGGRMAGLWDTLTGAQEIGPAERTDGWAQVGVVLKGSELRLELLRAGPESVRFEPVERAEGSRTTARLTGGETGSEIFAGSSGFRVSANLGELIVRLPPSVRTIVVVRGGVERRMDARDEPWTLDGD